MRMFFTETPAGRLVGVTGQTVTRWAHTGKIPFGVRPLVDGRYAFHRDDLEYARDVVKSSINGTGTRQAYKRRPAGIVRSGARR